MNVRKALFFDVDGTLISERNGQIPESAHRAIQAARQKGHLAFVNSGRVFSLLAPIRQAIAMDGYLCGCGTYIILGDKELYARKIPHERGIEIKAILAKHGMEGILEGKGGCHFRRETSPMPRLEQIRRNIQQAGGVSPYVLEEDNYDFDKFCCVSDASSDVAGFIRELPDFDVIDRGNDFWECVPKGHSKATAIHRVLEACGIPLENAYVFGDSTNDLSMFACAKHAVLMGRHDKELEPYATFVTKTVEEDGIAWAMEALGII